MAKKLFEPGQSGNPSGRKAGNPNKLTARARQIIADAIEDNEEKFHAAMASLFEARGQYAKIEACKIYASLIHRVLPQKLDITSDGEPVQINLNILSAEELVQFHSLYNKARPTTINLDAPPDAE